MGYRDTSDILINLGKKNLFTNWKYFYDLVIYMIQGVHGQIKMKKLY